MDLVAERLGYSHTPPQFRHLRKVLSPAEVACQRSGSERACELTCGATTWPPTRGATLIGLVGDAPRGENALPDKRNPVASAVLVGDKCPWIHPKRSPDRALPGE